MKKKASRKKRSVDHDTMRSEYDFSKGIRGVTASRYAEGANVIVVGNAIEKEPSLLLELSDAIHAAVSHNF